METMISNYLIYTVIMGDFLRAMEKLKKKKHVTFRKMHEIFI